MNAIRTLIPLCFALLTFSLKAKELYWMFDSGGDKAGYSYAQLYGKTGTSSSGEFIDALELQGDSSLDRTESEIHLDYTSFYLDLYSDLTGWVSSDEVEVSELGNYILKDPTDPPPSQYFGGWEFSSVPEPTSGLLVLMGLAGLGLRRKVEKLKS